MENLHRFLYTRDKPLMVKILSLLVAGVAILFLLDRMWPFAIIALLGATAMMLYQQGIEADFKMGAYRMITAIGPIRIGKWETFPQFKSISVFKVTIASSITGRSGTTVTQRDNVIQINLITQNNKRVKLLETKDINEAFKFAKKVSSHLDLNIWDATEKEGKWL